MENDNEIDKVIMNIKQGTGSLASLVSIQAQCVMLLIQFFYRMYKERLIRPREFKNVQDFIKATSGHFSIMNVPRTGSVNEKNLGKEMDELGIRYMICPDLDKKDNLFQVMVYDDDRGKFDAVYTRNLMANMHGGMKNIDELLAVTEGNTNIVSVPMEGKEDIIKNDFEALRINYSILPDLKVGDGEMQIVIANVDLPKVQHWFDLYKNDELKKGHEVGDLTVINSEKYAETGKMTEEEYIETGDEKVQEANKKYEGQEKSNVEKDALRMENVKTTSDVAYEKLHKDPDYLEITINHDSLIEKSMYAESVMQKSPQLFAARIPGTYGSNEETLVLPKKNVFETDEGKTYIAFIKKSDKPAVIGPDGAIQPKDQRKTGEEVYKAYDQVMRHFRNGQKQSLEKNIQPNLKQEVKTEGIALKQPTPPLKVK